MADIFGGFPERPDHEDFWHLSDIILYLDSDLDPNDPDKEKKEAQFNKRMDELGIDRSAVYYMALQRAMRAHGVLTRSDLVIKAPQVNHSAGGWLDGFAAGMLYERKYPKQ